MKSDEHSEKFSIAPSPGREGDAHEVRLFHGEVFGVMCTVCSIHVSTGW